jgi:transforming growth factor-beta-induced protein
MKKTLFRSLLVGLASLVMAGTVFAASQPHQLVSRKSIATVAAHTPDLSTLVKALKKTGLLRTLQRRGPYTVFAPTNRAFKRLTQKTLQQLMQNKTALRRILKYHVVSGRIAPQMLNKTMRVRTLQGQYITLKKGMFSRRYVNQARIARNSVRASNGYVYVINSVLIPSHKMPQQQRRRR